MRIWKFKVGLETDGDTVQKTFAIETKFPGMPRTASDLQKLPLMALSKTGVRAF